MTTGNFSPGKLRFHPNNGAGGVTIVAGAAGWVDTDVSATIGTDVNKIWLCECHVTGGVTQTIGVRAHGETADNATATHSVIYMTYCDSSGHCDFYRNAANNVVYSFIGYLQ